MSVFNKESLLSILWPYLQHAVYGLEASTVVGMYICNVYNKESLLSILWSYLQHAVYGLEVSTVVGMLYM